MNNAYPLSVQTESKMIKDIQQKREGLHTEAACKYQKNVNDVSNIKKKRSSLVYYTYRMTTGKNTVEQ